MTRSFLMAGYIMVANRPKADALFCVDILIGMSTACVARKLRTDICARCAHSSADSRGQHTDKKARLNRSSFFVELRQPPLLLPVQSFQFSSFRRSHQ